MASFRKALKAGHAFFAPAGLLSLRRVGAACTQILGTYYDLSFAANGDERFRFGNLLLVGGRWPEDGARHFCRGLADRQVAEILTGLSPSRVSRKAIGEEMDGLPTYAARSAQLGRDPIDASLHA